MTNGARAEAPRYSAHSESTRGVFWAGVTLRTVKVREAFFGRATAIKLIHACKLCPLHPIPVLRAATSREVPLSCTSSNLSRSRNLKL